MDLNIFQQHIRTLATLPVSESLVISCYLDLRSGISSLRNSLEERVLAIRGSLAPHHRPSIEKSWAVIEEQVPHVLNHGHSGAAIFIRDGSAPFFLSLRFRVPLPTSLAADVFPNIYHLVELKDTYHRYVIMLCSEKSIRILEINLGAVTHDLWKDRLELRRRVGHEWSHQHYQDHRRERTNQFFNNTIDELEQRMAAGGYTHLILAGPQHITAQVRNHLPASVADHLIDSVPASKNCRIEDVVDSTLALFIEEEQRESLSVTESLLRELRLGGLAVAGINPTMQALLRKQADILVLAKEFEFDIREKMVRIAESYGCLVEVVEQSKELIELGGVGCMLRYKRHPAVARKPREKIYA